MLKIAFDVDGTISDYPEVYSAMARALHSQGHKVIVVTGRPYTDKDFTVNQLFSWGFGTIIGSPPMNLYMYNKPYEWPCPDARKAEAIKRTLADWKAYICGELRVDCLIDDDPLVLAAVGATGMMVVQALPRKGR